ncbi:hypothetical protein BH11MYX2_BH11MYX2_25860 [soil metagenome]
MTRVTGSVDDHDAVAGDVNVNVNVNVNVDGKLR